MRSARDLISVIMPGLLCVLAGCGGPSYTLKLKPYSLQAKDFPLPSGLRVIFQEDRSQPSVVVTAVYDAGGSSDPRGKEGLAHVIEHLWFRAQHDGALPVKERITDLGGVFNAFTSSEETVFITHAPADALIPLLRLEALRMMDPMAGVTEEALGVERQVVRNELMWRKETHVFMRQLDVIEQMLFPPDHAFHRSIIGSHQTLSGITLEDARRFTKKHYRPAKVTIVVAGNFDRSKAAQFLAKAFPPALVTRDGKPAQKMKLQKARARIQGPSPEPPRPANTSVRTIKGPVTSPTVMLAWSLPGAHRQDHWTMNLTVGMMNQVLVHKLRPRHAIDDDRIEFVGCFLIPRRLHSVALCVIEVAPGQDPNRIITSAVDGLWELWNTSNPKLQRRMYRAARGAMMAGMLRWSASLDRSLMLSLFAHFTGRTSYFSHSFAEIAKLDAASARELAYKYLTRDRVAKLIVKPGRDQRSSVAFDSGASWSGSVFEKIAGENKRYIRLPLAAVARVASAPRAALMRTFALKNGLTVVLKQHGAAPFVSAALYLRGGKYTTRPVGLPQFAALRHRARQPLEVAGAWSDRTWTDGQQFGISTPSGNLPEALHLLYERVSTTASRWSRDGFERQLKRVKRREKSAARDPQEVGRRVLGRRLFGSHPLGQVTHDVAALEKLEHGVFKDWLERTLAPNNATLVVVGDLDLDRTRKLVEKTWSQWRTDRPGEITPPLPAPPTPAGRTVVLVDRPNASQAGITFGCHLAAPKAGDDAAREVLGTLLSEDFSQAIREKTGASYGVRVRLARQRGETAQLHIQTHVQADRLAPALDTILARLAEVGKGRVNRARLVKAKWTVARRASFKNRSTNEMLRTLVRQASYGYDPRYLGAFPGRLARVSPGDLARVIAPCVGHEVVAVVGPAASLKAPLEALKLPVVQQKK